MQSYIIAISLHPREEEWALASPNVLILLDIV